MRRTIVGFCQDEHGEWVAELSCFHNQHVRHQPPFQERAWVLDQRGRSDRIGSEIDCPLCDRAELPVGLRVVRSAGPFDSTTLPAGLRKAQRVAERTWGQLVVLEGTVLFSLDTEPPVHVRLTAPASAPIPPGVPHAVSPEGPVRLVVNFLVSDTSRPNDAARAVD